MAWNQWSDAWNDIIRYVIYPNEQLKQLMNVPKGTSIVDFIDKYFIRAGYTNTVLTNQSVRVIYADTMIGDTGNPNVTRNEMSFDIYVKLDDIHNVGKDRLRLRTNLIAAKLVQLLTKEKILYGYRFRVSGETDIGTSAIGYARHHIIFNYMRTY